MKRSSYTKWIIAAILFAVSSNSMAAIVVHTTDFIPDNLRSNYNGFESMPDGGSNAPSWLEDGILVEQINGLGNNIWTTCSQCGIVGTRSWYPNGGDYGYTQITRVGTIDFQSVGFLVGQGGSPGFFQYELLNDGIPVLQGTFSSSYVGWLGTPMQYLGFSGGGFDTIWVREVDGNPQLFFDVPSYNSLSLDSIELSQVPLPPAVISLLSGLVSLVALGRLRFRT